MIDANQHDLKMFTIGKSYSNVCHFLCDLCEGIDAMDRMKHFKTFLLFFNFCICASRALSLVRSCVEMLPTLEKHIHLKLTKKAIASTSAATMVFACILAPSDAAAKANLNSATSRGQRIFEQSCSTCHVGGQNAIAKKRTLEKEALVKFIFMEDETDISTFVRNSDVHRGALAFSGRLTDEDYNDIAKFVFEQAMNDKW